jgi:hypothetical protein
MVMDNSLQIKEGKSVMKNPKNQPTPDTTATGQFVAELSRFAKLTAAEQQEMLADILAERRSKGKLQDLRDALAEAIDESDDEDAGGIKYVLWG